MPKHTHLTYHAQRAFSLVELSIVLVILGLLTGGILSGQSLIRASELRNVPAEYQRYTTAALTFRDKYFALPGDMTNATRFWGAAHSNPTTCSATPSTTGTATCNGNGDGRINDGCMDAVCSGLQVSTPNESFRFWQQLANAGLIEGHYTGVQNDALEWSASTDNSPKSRLTGALWFVWFLGYNAGSQVTGSDWVFDGQYGNMFQFGGMEPSADPYMPIFVPEELWNIDTKVDDGKPATGKVVIMNAEPGAFDGCSDVANSTGRTAGGAVASYKLTSREKQCAMIVRGIF